ncbi:MAG TPA: TIGR03618 family F420-dependent PPOX class oxidoreductase [Dehalococcoidia bacterium]|nr:TIGR03618 family F420-dependent PPOX class oxidoreductase [Dehalococcoidia bacterium]
MAIPDSVRKVFEAGKLVHLVTLNRDGSPQISCVWGGIDGDDIVVASFGEYQKIRNLRRDPRVSLSVETDAVNAAGLNEYLVVHGTARIEEGGAAPILQNLAYIYIGPDAGKFPPGDDEPPPGFVTRITPLRYSGVGPWTGA